MRIKLNCSIKDERKTLASAAFYSLFINGLTMNTKSNYDQWEQHETHWHSIHSPLHKLYREFVGLKTSRLNDEVATGDPKDFHQFILKYRTHNFSFPFFFFYTSQLIHTSSPHDNESRWKSPANESTVKAKLSIQQSSQRKNLFRLLEVEEARNDKKIRENVYVWYHSSEIHSMRCCADFLSSLFQRMFSWAWWWLPLLMTKRCRRWQIRRQSFILSAARNFFVKLKLRVVWWWSSFLSTL